MEVHDIAANNFPNRSGTLQAIFEKVRKVGIAETGVFGLRLQGGSINYFLDQLKFLHPEQHCDVDRLNATFGETADRSQESHQQEMVAQQSVFP